MSETTNEPVFQPIENYGVIGNMRSIALVSIVGSIDFLCFPNFDSPSVFAALLDPEKGGFLRVTPCLPDMRIKQMYLPDTNILLTRFLSAEGVAELTDFMPVIEDASQQHYGHHIVRMLRVVKGTVKFKMRCAPRFDYARAAHDVRNDQDAICFVPQGENLPSMALHASFPLVIEDRDATAEFTLEAGQTAMLAFGQVDKEEEAEYAQLDKDSITEHFEATAEYWRKWIGRSNYKGRWREVVNRSALTLKLLCSQEYGSLIAAATFGLPERMGGERNWDYRYTWLRDSSFSLYAFMRLGFVEEASEFTRWLRQRVHEDAQRGPLQVMYRPDGEQKIDEEVLENLRGYRDSRPVRIGNAAYEQLQLDIYGELLDAVYLANKYGDAVTYDGWKGIKRTMDWLEKNWQRPDEGIWEVRGGAKEFLHSRLMCWVAFDRMIRLAEKRSLAAPFEKWLAVRDEIYESIFEDFWSEKLQSFVQYKGAEVVDASVLLMPLMRFISPTDNRWLTTLKAIEERLTEDALVYRYNNLSDNVDGLSGSEGSFTACSFWFVEALARSHQVDKARLLFEKMLGYANHLGLYAEQLGSSGEHLGNFPQAFTHLALISAATYLDKALNDGHTPGAWR